MEGRIGPKLPRGILADLKKLLYLALKGCEAVPKDVTDIERECSDTFRSVNLIASNMHVTTEIMVNLLKKLENLLIVLEHSRVPTVILTSDELDFFEIFFHELNLLGVRASEGMRDDNNDD